jgi:hypothetical protein
MIKIWRKNYNFSLLLYGRETCSVSLREEHGLGVSQNKVMRRICGPKKEEVIGRWRKLHSE